MLEFIVANLATILMAAVIVVIVAFIIAGMVRDRKKGAGSCGPACSCCPNAGLCHGSVQKVHTEVEVSREGHPEKVGQDQ